MINVIYYLNSGSTKGYCYIRFQSQDAAVRCIDHLDNYELRANIRLVVQRSNDNRRLRLTNLPADLNRYDASLLGLLHRLTDCVSYEVLTPLQNGRNASVVIEFGSHEAASSARRYVMTSDIYVASRSVGVEWENPNSQNGVLVNKVRRVLSRIRVL